MLLITPKTRRRLEIGRRGLLTGAAALSAFEGLKLSDAQAQSPCGSFYPIAPPQAVAAGLTAPIFVDDFNVPGTVAPNGNATSGYNIYPSVQPVTNTTKTDTVNNGNGTLAANVTAFTKATAAGITNGNADGGSFASPNGGILTLINQTAQYGGIPTVTTTATSTQRNGTTGLQGTFKDFYVQTYLQFQPLFVCDNQWPALVFYVQNTAIPPGQTLQGSQELDQMESFAGNAGFTGNLSLRMTSSGHCFTTASQPFQGGNTYNGPVGGSGAAVNTDNNWHLMGYMKQSTGANTSNISIYWDNVLQSQFGLPTPLLGGPGGTPTTGWNWAEIFEYFYAISAAYGSTGNSSTSVTGCMNIDYIQFFGSPS